MSSQSSARLRDHDRWPARRLVAAAAAGTVIAVVVGVPTGVVPTPLYTRMTPVLWWNYPVWMATAVLGGLLLATYVQRPEEATARSGLGSASGGSLVAAFAVGCPTCNKLVVAALGVSGALTIWAPLQPLLGALSVAGLAWTLRRRVQSEYACRAPSPPGAVRTSPQPLVGAPVRAWPFAAPSASPIETTPASGPGPGTAVPDQPAGDRPGR